MRTIGLLGGMSWQSSIEYERAINERVAQRLGGVASADLLIRSFNFAEVEALQAAGDWPACSRLLTEAAMALEAAGAQAIAICTNTMHRVAEQVEGALSVPLLHIADATGATAKRFGITRVALLGTRYTMELPFMKDRLQEIFGLEVAVPEPEARDAVHRIIYDELVQGIFTDASRREMLAVMRRLVDEGAQGVIAGCTEIEQLVTNDDASRALGVPYLATAKLHADYIAEFALADL